MVWKLPMRRCGTGILLAIAPGVLAVSPRPQPATAALEAAHGQDGRKTVWSGVYTEQQAARGQKAFGRSCGGCHRDDLRGGDEGQPALTGIEFMAEWRDRTVADLLQLVAQTMPKTAPGSLGAQTYLEIVAFLLKSNEMPPGATELPTDADGLEQIRFAEKPPKR